MSADGQRALEADWRSLPARTWLHLRHLSDTRAGELHTRLGHHLGRRPLRWWDR